MKLTIHRTDHDQTVTIRMQSNGSGSHLFSAERTAPQAHQYAMVDGMLWTLLKSELHAFLLEGPEKEAHAMRIGHRLEKYMALDDFYHSSQEEAQRITRTIAKHIADLSPLTLDDAEMIAWHAHIQQLADVLKMRMLQVGDTWHGIATFLKVEPVAA